MFLWIIYLWNYLTKLHTLHRFANIDYDIATFRFAVEKLLIKEYQSRHITDFRQEDRYKPVARTLWAHIACSLVNNKSEKLKKIARLSPRWEKRRDDEDDDTSTAGAAPFDEFPIKDGKLLSCKEASRAKFLLREKLQDASITLLWLAARKISQGVYTYTRDR